MILKLKKTSKKELITICSLALLPPLIFVVFKILGFVVTFSGSVPIGVYKKTSYRSDYGIFCLPLNVAEDGYNHKFIEHSSKCGNGFEPLIKKIIARDGDYLEITNNKIRVNSKTSYLTPTNKFDSNSKPIRRSVENGNLSIHGFWLYGDGSPLKSWDSRYFGEISNKYLQSYVKPIITKINISGLS